MNAPTEAQCLEALRQVIDPELGLNIVDLGLIYGLSFSGARVTVQMTLTTPGCPMSESIAYGVRQALLQLESVEAVDVEIVWEPQWTPDMISREPP